MERRRPRLRKFLDKPREQVSGHENKCQGTRTSVRARLERLARDDPELAKGNRGLRSRAVSSLKSLGFSPCGFQQLGSFYLSDIMIDSDTVKHSHTRSSGRANQFKNNCRYSVSRRLGVKPASRIMRRSSSSVVQLVTPAERTTFSSSITEPTSLPPKRRPNWQTFRPWVTQLDCTFSKLERNRREMASTFRYSTAVASSQWRPPSAVFLGWKLQGINAVKPPVSSCRSKTRWKWLMRCSNVSPTPNIMVAVVHMPSLCAVRCTLSQSSVRHFRRAIL